MGGRLHATCRFLRRWRSVRPAWVTLLAIVWLLQSSLARGDPLFLLQPGLLVPLIRAGSASLQAVFGASAPAVATGRKQAMGDPQAFGQKEKRLDASGGLQGRSCAAKRTNDSTAIFATGG